MLIKLMGQEAYLYGYLGPTFMFVRIIFMSVVVLYIP